MCRDSLSVPSPRGGTGGGEQPTRCEADRSAGPRHRRGGSPCVSCPRVPVGKYTSEGSSSLLAGRLPPWIPACTGATDIYGGVCARADHANLGSDLLLGQGGEFGAEVGISGTTRPHTKWKTRVRGTPRVGREWFPSFSWFDLQANIVDQDLVPDPIRCYPDLSRATLSLSRHLSPQRDSAA